MKRKKVSNKVLKKSLEIYLNEKVDLIYRKRGTAEDYSFSGDFVTKMSVLIRKEKKINNSISYSIRKSSVVCFVVMILILLLRAKYSV